jgi:hypothetical protein
VNYVCVVELHFAPWEKSNRSEIFLPFVAADFWGIDFASLPLHASLDL